MASKKYMSKMRRKFRKVKRRNVKTTRPSRALLNTIKRVVNNQTETKVATYSSNVTAFNQQVNSSGDCLRLVPQISQGTGQGQRIGLQIKAKSLNIRGVLTFTLSQTTLANLRIGVRMMIIRCKRFSDWQQTQTDFASSYTRLLEGSINGMNGDLANWNAPPNTDYFSVVKDKRFIMSLSYGTSPQNVSSSVKYYNFNIPYSKKTLTYDENYSTTDPVNYAYVMILGYTKLDGSTPDSALTTYLTNQYVTTMKYEDA